MKRAPVWTAALIMASVSGCQALLVFSVRGRDGGGADGSAEDADGAASDGAAQADGASRDAGPGDATTDATVCGLPARVVFADTFDDPNTSKWILDTGRGYLDAGQLIVPAGNDVAALMPFGNDPSAKGMRVTAHVACRPPTNGTVAFDSVGVHLEGTQLWIWCSDQGHWRAYAQRPTGSILFDSDFADVTPRDEVAVTLCEDGRYEFRANGAVTTGSVGLEVGVEPNHPVAVLHTNGQKGEEIVDDVVVEQAP